MFRSSFNLASERKTFAYPCPDDPVLARILRLSEGTSCLDQIAQYLAKNPALTDRDFRAILEIMPRGLSWGWNTESSNEDRQYKKTLELFKKYNGTTWNALKFEPMDCHILIQAMSQIKVVKEPLRLDQLLADTKRALRSCGATVSYNAEFLTSRDSLLNRIVEELQGPAKWKLSSESSTK
jgi:hypothetical protein